jgi:RNA polymerase sigma factor (sigma-70 family)
MDQGMSDIDSRLTTSDEELIANARSGDQSAFAELWRRHYRSGARVARQFTSSIDADDLVSEAYTRIYQRVLAGGGPSGAFRPYLYTTIRNLASSWGAKSRDVQVEDISDYEDPSTIDDPVAVALDRTLTARAFRSLPERWQSVLWYTEVEGMDPHEVAPILGMSANGVAALSYRAREGLRKAWLQAHVSEAGTSEACKWTISRLGDAARHSLTTREQEKMTEHLLTCAKCQIVSEEVDEVGSHLAMVLLPVMLGASVGGILLATLGHAGSAAAATAASAAIPAVPASFTVLAAPAAFAPAVTAGLSMGAATGVSALVGSLAVAAAVGGSVVLGMAPHTPTPPSAQTVASAQHSSSSSSESNSGSGSGSGSTTGSGSGVFSSPDPAGTSGVIGGVIGGVGGAVGDLGNGNVGGALGDTTGAVGGAVGGVVGAVTGTVGGVVGALTPTTAPTGQAAPVGAPATVKVDLSGNGTPGATVAAQAGGVVYATAKVSSSGSFSLQIDALPKDAVLQLSQKLTVLGITLPINIPLSLNTGALGVVIKLLN